MRHSCADVFASCLVVLSWGQISHNRNIFPSIGSCDDDSDLTEYQTNCIEDCFNKSQICYGRNLSCHDINQQGPCDDEELLVLTGNCGEAGCIPNPNLQYADNPSSGCNANFVRYNGDCKHIFDALPCDVPGMRVQQTVFGEIKCECAKYLGFIEINETQNSSGRSTYQNLQIQKPTKTTCYHEYLQGPCDDGKQLIRNGDGYTCIKNTCQIRGEFRWRDNNCYPLAKDLQQNATGKDCNDILGWVDLNNNATKRNVQIVCQEQFATRGGSTFDNCQIRANTTGKCLSNEVIPAFDPANITTDVMKNHFKKYFDKLGLSSG